jgi:hypothetical protein
VAWFRKQATRIIQAKETKIRSVNGELKSSER